MTFETVQSISVNHRQASLDAQTHIVAAHLADAHLRTIRHSRRTIYADTAERARWRSLFEAAARLPEAVLAVTFVKAGDTEARTMLCQVLPEGDYTRRYALVWDLEAQDYRRVNLDGIVKVTLETHALGVAESLR